MLVNERGAHGFVVRCLGRLKARRRYEYALVWGVCLLVLLLGMAKASIYPFGDTAFVRADGLWQYVGYTGWASEILHGEGSPFYSFAKSLGGGTLSLFQGMAMSPTTLLLAFVDSADVPKFFSLLMMLKLPLCGVTCHVFLRKRFGFHGIVHVLLSCSYGTMMCLFTTGSNIMWLDNIVALPLFALGVYYVVQRKRPLLLFVVTALCIVDNWYCAYMACLFSVICFFLEVAFSPQRSWMFFIKRGLCFACTMLLALGASMVVFLPIIKAMFGAAAVTTNAAASGVSWSSASYSLDDLLRNYYLGNASVFEPDFGNFPISGLALLLAMSLFFIPGHRKIKVAVAVVLAVFVASYVYQPLGLIWSGFVRADSYIPRFIYIWQFSLVVAAALAFSLLKRLPRKKRAVSLAVPLVLFSGAMLYEHLRIPFDSLPMLVFQLAVMLLFAVLLCVPLFSRWAYEGKEEPRTPSPVRAFAGGRWGQAMSVIVPCALSLCFVVENAWAVSRIVYTPEYNVALMSVDSYEEYMKGFEAHLNEVASSESESFYRAEKGTFSSLGDSDVNDQVLSEYMALGMRGLTHYSSYMQQSVNDLLGSLGYCDTPGFRSITVYNSPMLLPDSLLGLKYLFVQYDYLPGCSMVGTAEDVAEGANIFRNDNALPLGYGVAEDISSVEWSEDVFSNQEKWLSAMTGDDESGIYRDALVVSRENEGDADAAAATESATAADEFLVTAQADGPLYLYLNTDDGVYGGAKNAGALFADGSFVQSVSAGLFDTNVVYLGDYTEGASVEVRFERSAEMKELDVDQVFAASLNRERCEESLAKLAAAPLQVKSVEDGCVEADFQGSFDGQKLLLTIPVEDGWKVSVNGQDQEPQSFNGLMVLEMDEGENYLSMEYHVPGMAAGFGVSLASVAIFTLWRVGAYAKSKGKSPERLMERGGGEKC